MEKNNFVVLLDLDNTIWNHVPFAIQIVEMAKYLNIPYEEEFYNQLSNFWAGDTLQDILVSMNSIGNMAEKEIPYLTKHGARGVDFLDSMTITDTVSLNEGAKEFLSFLKSSGYTVLAYTDWFMKYQCFIMERLGIREYFDEIYAWDGTYQKPNKKRIQNLVAKFPSKRFIYVGDSLQRDMESANHIDCIAIWYTNKYVENDLKIDYHTNNLSSIIEYLKSIK